MLLKHARRLAFSIGLATATLVATVAVPAQAQTPYLQLLPSTQSKYAAIVVDAKSGEVLYAKRADSTRYPASITKVMTLYLTYEALASGKLKLDDRVVFSPHAAAQAPTKLGLRAGDSISVSEAIQAMTTLSANDAAVAMAEKIGGSDSRNVSTARDIALLSRAVMRDFPQYYRYFSQTNFSFRGRNIRNHNHLLTGVPGVDGLKTGFTNASGFNIAISGVRDGRRLIVVVLGGPTRAARDQNAEDLLLTGFDVMGRRARGEQITVAQNLFEGDPIGPVVRDGVAQGDEAGAERIVLASAKPIGRASKIEIVEPAKRGSKGDIKRAEAWGIQVGAFRARSDAKEQIALIEKRFDKHVDDAKASTEKLGRTWRARFSGMSEYEAKQACKAIKAKHLACAVVQG